MKRTEERKASTERNEARMDLNHHIREIEDTVNAPESVQLG
jgi:hypothetical protein